MTTYIDLCCGIGGFHQALRRMNMTCVFACDIDENCREIYELNYNLKPEGDITKIDISSIPKFDVLCAGFPCQTFSKAGHQDGFNDDRGNIFFHICDIIAHHLPEYLVLENVRNLVSHDKGNTWRIIKEKLCSLGYNTYDKPLILNTLYFGVPQSRERVLILCKRNGSLPLLPTISKRNIQPTSLESILEKKVDEKYRISGKLQTAHEVWNAFLIILKSNNIAIPKFPIWTDWWDSDGNNTTVTKYNPNLNAQENARLILEKQKAFYKKYKNWIDKNRVFWNEHKEILQDWLRESRLKKEWLGAVRKMEWQTGVDNLTMDQVLWSPRGSGIRIKNTDYAPTLVAMASMIPIYGPQYRQLTPRECARLQSFPDDFIISKNDQIAYKQFGNAVNVLMIEKAAQFLIHNKPLF